MACWIYFAPILLLIFGTVGPCCGMKRAQPGGQVPAMKKPKPPPLPPQWWDKEKFRDAFTSALVAAGNPVAKKVFESALGHGGRYDALQPVVSRKELIESDHAPHYGILSYLENVDGLPDNLKDDLKFRQKLKKDKSNTKFDSNADKIKALTDKIKASEKEFSQRKIPMKISLEDFSQPLQDEYKETVDRIKEAYKNRHNPNTPGKLEDVVKKELEELEKNVKKELENLKDIRNNARLSTIPGILPLTTRKELKRKLEELEGWENERIQLEAMNEELKRPLTDFKAKMGGKMGVLSIPYEIHRKFPSTDKIGLNDEIEGLKGKTATDAQDLVNKYQDIWQKKMRVGLNANINYLQPTDPYPTTPNPTDEEIDKYFKKQWKANFQEMYEVWTKKPRPGTSPAKLTFLDELRGIYAKYWMTRVITAAKNKDFKGLNKLYISEYEIYLSDNFKFYKKGIKQQLKASVEVGLLKAYEVNQLVREHKLDENPEQYDMWRETHDLIERQTFRALRRDEFQDRFPKPKHTLPKSCFKLRAGGQGGDCIFTVQNKDVGHEGDVGEDEGEGSIFPKETGIPDGQTLVSIDSDKLSEYLESFRNRELTFDEVQTKESVVELVSKNQGKLVGGDDVLQKTKSLLKQELLNIHNNQVRLSRSFARDKEFEGSFPVETISNYDRVKIGKTHFVERASKFIEPVGEAGGAYGKIMLANGLVTALHDHDVTGLAILGGRVGLDIGLEAIEKTGALMAQKLGSQILVKIGSRMSSFVGRMAGPMGAVADIGISIYSLSNSIKALNDPKATKWEQNDAIADIVSDSINIAVTAATAVLSIVFPPLAPIMAVVNLIVNVIGGFIVSAIHAADHVAELNEEVPLLEWEKREEYARSFVGDSTSKYLLDIKRTKEYNNALANLTMLWLKDNPEFAGSFTPSKTLTNGKCHLTETVVFVRGGSKNTQQRGSWECSSYGGDCPGAPYSCGHTETSHNVYGTMETHIFDCECDTPKDFSDLDVINNVVDLSAKQLVYNDRADPNFLLPKGFKYYCVPNSLSIKYAGGGLISDPNPVSGYLCDGVLGMYHPNPKGHWWLYDLKTGEDRITLSSSDGTESFFRVGDGVKHFTGGGGDDTFLLDGPCSSLSGRLSGGGYNNLGNMLVLGENCNRGNSIEVHLEYADIGFAMVGGEMLEIENMERIIGRKGQAETFHLSCSTKYVAGGGGEYWILLQNMDRLYFPSCSRDSPANVTIVAEGYTFLDFINFRYGFAAVFVTKEQAWLVARIPMVPAIDRDGGAPEIFFKFDQVGGLTSATITNDSELKLATGNGGTAVFSLIYHPFFPKSDTQYVILFSEPGKVPYQLQVDLETLTVRALYRINSDAAVVRYAEGLGFLQNLFILEYGIGWKIKGSQSQNDVFFLRDLSFEGVLEGGGGYNTLVLEQSLSQEVIIIRDANVMGNDGRARVGFNNIHSIIGRADASESIQVGCEVKQLDLKGGRVDRGDEIGIYSTVACDWDLTIVASRGRTIISNGMGKGRLIVEMGPPPIGEKYNYANLTLENVYGRGPDSVFFIYLNYPSSQVSSMTITSDIVKIYLPNSELLVKGPFQEKDAIIFAPDPALGITSIITRIEGGDVVAFHNLTKDSNTQGGGGGGLITGFPNLENRFSISAGVWNIVPSTSDKNNVFLLKSPSISGTLVGGGVGGNAVNKVIITEEDWGAGPISPINSDGQFGSLQMRNIQAFQGRPGSREELEVNLNRPFFSFVSLGGGTSADYPDLITFPDNGLPIVDQNLTIVAAGATTIVGAVAKTAKYPVTSGQANIDIYITPDPKRGGRIQFSGVFTISKEHLRWRLAVQVPPYKIQNISIRPEMLGKKMGIRLDIVKEPGNYESRFINVDTFLADSSQFEQGFSLLLVSESFQVVAKLVIDPSSGTSQLVHFVTDELSGREVRGSSGIVNIFEIISTSKSGIILQGGPLDDVFIVESDSFFSVTLNGYGGTNTLVLGDSLSSERIAYVGGSSGSVGNLYLDGDIHSFYSKGHIFVNSIQMIKGRKDKQEHVKADCTTTVYDLGGGKDEGRPDIIDIYAPYCTKEITIHADKYTTVNSGVTLGNYTYVIKSPETFSMGSYNLGRNLSHSFIFYVEALEDVKSILGSQGGQNIIINFKGVEKSFKVLPDDGGSEFIPPKFQFVANSGQIADLVVTEGPGLGDIVFNPFQPQTPIHIFNPFSNESSSATQILPQPQSTRHMNIRTTISSNRNYYNVSGIGGTGNDILVYSLGDIGIISGSELDDSVFLFESTSYIQAINGGSGMNRLQLMPGFWNGSELAVDLRGDSPNSGISLVLPKLNESGVEPIMIVGRIENMTIFVGRSTPEFERVTISCDTLLVAEAEEIFVPDGGCSYDTRFILGPGARVRFTLRDGKNSDVLSDNNEPRNINCSSSVDSFCEELIDSIEEESEFSSYAPSIFYYDFTQPCNFDIEVDTFSRLSDTRHIFNLKFNLSDISNIRVSTLNDTTRLVYSLHSSPGLEYSHILGDLYETEMFYARPEFMTEDGFSILITRFDQVMLSFGNLEEILNKEDIKSGFVPTLAEIGRRLEVNSIIETKKDFIYSGNPLEISTLSNRDNLTSHLIGFNGTTYQIFAGIGDVLIYPQRNSGGTAYSSSAQPQIIDLTDIVAQIEKKDTVTGVKYMPTVTASGSDLEIVFPLGYPDIFPGKIIIVNGTTLAKEANIKVLLRTVAVTLGQTGPGGRWGFTPGQVSIPQGHVVHLDPQDFEENTEILDHNESDNVTYSCTREGDALIVTNIDSFHQVFDQGEHILPTSFVISNIYDNPNSDQVLSKVNIKLGPGNENLCNQEFKRINARTRNFIVGGRLPKYSDVLIQSEIQILQGQPNISSFFNASTLVYYDN